LRTDSIAARHGLVAFAAQQGLAVVVQQLEVELPFTVLAGLESKSHDSLPVVVDGS